MTRTTIGLLAALLSASVALLPLPLAHADPMGTNCQTNMLGATYCDGPVRPDGTWVRCVDVPPQSVYGVPEGQWNGWTNPYHNCFTAPSPTPVGQPPEHIGDGL